MSFRAEFRHPLVGWRNAVEEPFDFAQAGSALGRNREAGFSTSQNCPRADNLAALEMTEEVCVSLYCAIFSNVLRLLAMDVSVREHLQKLERRLQLLSQEIMENASLDERNKLEAEIRAANLAIAHYKAALKLEESLSNQPE